MGNGDGTFEPTYDEVNPGQYYGPTYFASADFNLDGHPDALTRSACSPAQISVVVYNPEERGTFTPTQTIPLDGIGIDCNGYALATAVADFTGDGLPDIAMAEKEGGIYADTPNKLVILQGMGDGTFEPFSESFPYDSITSGWPSYMDVGDINEDGLPDLVTSGGSYQTIVHLATGPGTFAEPDVYLGMRGYRGVEHTYLHDLNGDGHLDLIEGDISDQTIVVRPGIGDGTFGAPVGYDDLGRQSNLTFADLDHDGHQDIIKGRTNGNFPVISLFPGARDTLVDSLAVDLNGDGNEEVLAVNEAMDRLHLFVGDNLGGLTRQPDLLAGRVRRGPSRRWISMAMAHWN